MEHEDLTECIIGCAYKVYNKLGAGFLESVYERSLLIELRKSGIQAEAQKAINVYYEGELVGEFTADVVIDDLLIIELKALRTLGRPQEVQLVNYLKATGIPYGLLINFAEDKVEVRRKYRDYRRD